jgi:uncharacterized GH25 family protein
MKTGMIRICAAVAAAMTLAGSASAHRAWMLPSTFTLSGEEQWVSVEGAVSNNLFFANHNALRLEPVTVTAPDGSDVAIENAASGKLRSMFDVKLDRQGTYKISSASSGYSASWKEGEETKRWRGTAEELESSGAASKPGAEISRNSRRNETFVTLGTPTASVFASDGAGLELKPVTHPNDIFTGENVSFQFLVDGKPAASVAAQIVRGSDRYRDSEDAVTVASDASGMITFVLDEAGAYWLEADHEGQGLFKGKPITERMTYVMTFEALPN